MKMQNKKIRSFADMKADWRKWCSYWRAYPDRFLDNIRPANSPIKLYFYQRVMLRTLFRYKKVYFTFTRGTAKSYTQILALYLKCIMFPNTHLFIAAPTKVQASKISQENLEKIWKHFPLLFQELEYKVFQNDYTAVVLKNGSRLDVLQVAQSSRGRRKNGGAVEEIVDPVMKKDTLNEVVIPTMANDRIAMCGGVDPNELHKFQWYITTSGTRQSFAYEKLMEVTQEMADGKNSFSMGASYELACMYGQLDLNFIMELKHSPTMNPLSFAREYESEWTGTSDNSLVQLEDLLKCRIIAKAEDRATDKHADYILAYDVARSEGSQNASCALVVIKIVPRGDGTYQKHVVNVYSFEGTHFLDQALFLKRKANDFRARMVCIDSNGLGIGLIDQLVLEIDENPAWEVSNDDRWHKYRTENSVPLIYSIKSQSKEMKSSDIHNIFMQAIANHKVKFLVSEGQAKINSDRKKSSEQLSKELMPYIMTDLMCEEVMNLEYKQNGNQTQVKQISKSINKDKFSALEYGLFYIYTLEKTNAIRKHQPFNVDKFFLVKEPKYKL